MKYRAAGSVGRPCEASGDWPVFWEFEGRLEGSNFFSKSPNIEAWDTSIF